MSDQEEAERIEAGRLLFAGPIDFERGVKISGSRFYVMKGMGAKLLDKLKAELSL